jgi:Glycosyl hydrolase family 12
MGRQVRRGPGQSPLAESGGRRPATDAASIAGVSGLLLLMATLAIGLLTASTLTAGATPSRDPGTAVTASGSAPSTISLFPKAKGDGPWEWNKTCRFIPTKTIPPSTKGGCSTVDPVFGPIILNGNLWNIGATAATTVKMGISSEGELSVSTGRAAAPQRSKSTWVLGFPDITYGTTPQAPGDSPKTSPNLPLPMKLNALPKNLIATASYQLTNTSTVRYDLAYDLWIEPQRTVETPRTGTIEFMIWTDDGNHALPPGFKENVTMAYAVNGVEKSAPWGVYLTNGNKAAKTNTTVYLVLTKPVNNAQVSVDLSRALLEMDAVLTKYDSTHWSNIPNYYLDSIPLGTEFGKLPGASTAGPFSWSLHSYRLGVNQQLP